ncbi:hypothetical protein C7B79_35575, partial [Chroococcidiopsis cubana CCALA 043]
MLFCGSRDFISTQTNKGNFAMSHGLKHKPPNELSNKENETVFYRFVVRFFVKLGDTFLAG